MDPRLSSSDITSILIIEDDEVQRRLLDAVLADLLGAEGCTIEHADRLAAALVLLHRQAFDAVLVDLSLPDSQGFDTFAVTRAAAPHAAIVVLTGADDEELGVRAVNAGAQDFLTKGSYPLHVLGRCIRYAIERHRRVQELRALALMDELTGVYNRRGFMVLARHELKVATRAGCSATLLFIDVDGMKYINDTLGHHHGDTALIEVARLLNTAFPDSDVIARMGGDEFCVLLVDHGDERDPASQLRQCLDARNATSPLPYGMSVSMGVVRHDPDEPCSLEDLIERADKAMYRDKRCSRERPRLLVVDDDPAVGVLCEVWFGEGYEVMTATTATAALETAGRCPPDLVLLDLRLPDATGTDVAGRLRAVSKAAGVPIIMLTGSEDETSERDCLRAGVDDYVTKPVDEEVLRARMDNVLRRYIRS